MKVSNKKIINILQTARSLFWKHGFKRVSVEEICQKAGVSKMTFYRYFPNKIELARTVYDKEVDEGIGKFKEIMTNENTSPLQKMEKILLLKLEGSHEISREFLEDFYSNPELGLSAHVAEKTKMSWDEIITDFKSAQEKGWFRKDFKPEALLAMAYKFAELITDENLLKLYSTPQDLVMEMARFYTYGIMPYGDQVNNEKG